MQSGLKQVVPRAEAVARVRAACDARDDGADILIVARTDARQVSPFVSRSETSGGICIAIELRQEASACVHAHFVTHRLRRRSHRGMFTLFKQLTAAETRNHAVGHFIMLAQAEGLPEALARAEAFAEAGADVLFIDALESADEMRALTGLRGVASGVRVLSNHLISVGMYCVYFQHLTET